MEFLYTIASLMRRNKLTNNNFFKSIFRKIKLHRLEEEKKNFRKNGRKVLNDFDVALKNAGVKYCLAFGTMLGAVRNGKFIPHDSDIDTTVWIDDYNKEIVTSLQEQGFKILRTFNIEDQKLGYEETYEKDGVLIDIFYLYQSSPMPYCCDFLVMPGAESFNDSMKKFGTVLPRKIELPVSRKMTVVNLEGMEFCIPENYDEILRFRYGDDYMIPNPGWRANGFNPHISIMEGVKAIFTGK